MEESGWLLELSLMDECHSCVATALSRNASQSSPAERLDAVARGTRPAAVVYRGQRCQTVSWAQAEARFAFKLRLTGACREMRVPVLLE